MFKISKPQSEFESYVFTDEKIKKLVDSKVYDNFINLKKANKPIPYAIAQDIAEALKTWAIELGATHYSHWFQPLTGKTAGKQVSFLELKDKKIIQTLDAKTLIKGETDASSFPNGGSRMTFEARGYTVWDYTSPCMIKQDLSGNKVLIIPTAFCSYHGTALDEKTPLLRAINAINEYGVKVLHNLGYTDVNNITVNVGCEQEYFVIPKSMYLKRQDLALCGRTLLGAMPIKSQEKHHHYFGAISNTMSNFMASLNKELWKIGITAKTQHNEVAPCQFEIAPIYAPVNIACDQNQILMETLHSVAEQHDLIVLLNEKPFKGINGSGKHTNWSLSTDTGLNLLDSELEDKKLFLLFFTSVIASIDEFAPLVRLSSAYHGNDVRLGGDEAPPAIISIYIGNVLQKALDAIENNEVLTKETLDELDLKVSHLPQSYKDNCDRNRTSPFAFTGNKFEFRMVGSSQPVALPNTVLITIVAHKLKQIAQIFDNSELSTDDTIYKAIKQNIVDHKKIIFNGNGYDHSWHEEAKKRKLEQSKSCYDTYKCLDDKSVIELFDSLNVFNPQEVKLRQEIMYASYVETVLTEAQCLYHMCYNSVIPSLNNHIKQLNSLAFSLGKAGLENTYHNDTLILFTQTVSNIYCLVITLKEDIECVETFTTPQLQAEHIKNNVLPTMHNIRKEYDQVEPLLPLSQAPFVNYNDILYLNGI